MKRFLMFFFVQMFEICAMRGSHKQICYQVLYHTAQANLAFLVRKGEQTGDIAYVKAKNAFYQALKDPNCLNCDHESKKILQEYILVDKDGKITPVIREAFNMYEAMKEERIDDRG